MRNLNLLLIALLSITLFAGCAKEESTVSTTTTAAGEEGTVVPPPEPDEAVPADTTTTAAEEAGEEPAAAEPETEEPTNTPSTEQAAANTPAPMLPRRGEVESMAEARAESDAAKSQRITIPDAYEILRAGNGVLVDVRNADAYQYQRIPGAVNIPLGEVANRASELPQDKWIITYCTCPAEESSGAAATQLANMGFERVAALLGGMQGWRGANLPVEFGQ